MGRIAPKCSSSLCEAVKIRALSSEDKKTRDITTMFGDIVVECEPHMVRLMSYGCLCFGVLAFGVLSGKRSH